MRRLNLIYITHIEDYPEFAAAQRKMLYNPDKILVPIEKVVPFY